jgi:hypothetical protein
MKYFFMLFLLGSSGLGYFRYGQPQNWNSCLDSLKAPAPSNLPAQTTLTDSSASSTPAPPVQVAEIISPDSTNYTSEHVKEVAQPTSTTPSPPERPVPTSIPSTITTIEGTIYTGCTLSQVTPDGISFLHSTGAATVKFSDLDPAFAATFNYDATTAKKYEQEQALRQSMSDSQRAVAEAHEPDSISSVLTASVPGLTPQPLLSTLSAGQRAGIQAQIAGLQNDISFMQQQENKVVDNRLITDGNHVSSGGYFDKIAADNAQIKQLQQELK